RWAWFSGKVSLGNFPDLAGAVNKFSESVKNIEKNFDTALGLDDKPAGGTTTSEANCYEFATFMLMPDEHIMLDMEWLKLYLTNKMFLLTLSFNVHPIYFVTPSASRLRFSFCQHISLSLSLYCLHLLSLSFALLSPPSLPCPRFRPLLFPPSLPRPILSPPSLPPPLPLLSPPSLSPSPSIVSNFSLSLALYCLQLLSLALYCLHLLSLALYCLHLLSLALYCLHLLSLPARQFPPSLPLPSLFLPLAFCLVKPFLEQKARGDDIEERERGGNIDTREKKGEGESEKVETIEGEGEKVETIEGEGEGEKVEKIKGEEVETIDGEGEKVETIKG
ncbi:hypothetical protein Tco_1158648, partial [Tanacetum coccineum]